MNKFFYHKYSWLISFLFPISSFIFILFHPENRKYKFVFVLFFTFVGIAFLHIGNGADVDRYILDLKQAYMFKGDFFQYFHSRPIQQQIDYYSSFMLWLVSRFTNSSCIFLGLIALVFAIIFSINTNYIIKRIKICKVNILLLIVFIFMPKIIFLTHRWWTALQIFLLGILPIIFEKKYWNLIWCFIAALLFHFSFIYPLVVFIISLLIPVKVLWPYLVIYNISMLIKSLDMSFFNSFFEMYFPFLLSERTISYINAELIDSNFFSQSAKIAMNLVNIIICNIIYFKDKKCFENNLMSRFFIIILLLGSFSNVLSLTAWGWRYLELSNILFITFYMIYLSNEKRYQITYTYFRWCFPLLLYFIAFQTRGFLGIIGPYQFFAGNYISTWFMNDTTSMWNMIMGR